MNDPITLISEKEAADICGLSASSAIAYHRKKKRITPIQTDPIILYDLKDVMALKLSLRKEIAIYNSNSEKTRCADIDFDNIPHPFGRISWEKDESFRFLDLISYPKLTGNPFKYYSTKAYAISNHGRIVDLLMRKELPQQTVAHGYKQVALLDPFHKKSSIFVMVQTLVGLLWCENERHCSEFHHINGIKDDNRPENLLPCTHTENLKADSILRKCNENPEDEELKAKYNEYIESIRELNKEKDGEELRIVIDPDDASGNFHCFFLKKSAYDRLANGGTWEDIAPDDICAEYVDITKNDAAPTTDSGETEKKK